MEYPDDRILKRLCISLIGGVTASEALLLEQQLSLSDLSGLTRSSIEGMIRRRLRTRTFSAPTCCRQAERIFNSMQHSDMQLLHITDTCYPQLLREIYDPPYLLYYRGSPPPWGHEEAVALIGTRRAGRYALQLAFKTGMQLGLHGVPLISGLAEGIDSAGHQGVVAVGGKTWAVVGSGLDHLFPPSGYVLSKDIVYYGGGIISEFPPDHPPTKWTFPKRNRIISGLSTKVHVIEAPERSGTMITVDYALDHGREISVNRQCRENGTSPGTDRLADQGAAVVGSFQELMPGLLCSFEVQQSSPEEIDPELLLDRMMSRTAVRFADTIFTIRSLV